MGANRLFFASIDAAAYPLDWNSAGFGFFDLRGELAAIVPLPLYRRHTLTLDAARRAISPARPTGERLLRVGGYVLQPLARSAGSPEVPRTDYPFLPPGALFVEPLRGFEDYPFAVDRIGDRQRPLPAADHHRLRLGIDAVGAAGAVHPADRLRPVRGGGQRRPRRRPAHRRGRIAVAALPFWILPITIQYQLARRFTDDQALVHLSRSASRPSSLLRLRRGSVWALPVFWGNSALV